MFSKEELKTIEVMGDIENNIVLVHIMVILPFYIMQFLLPCFSDFQVTQSHTKQA